MSDRLEEMAGRVDRDLAVAGLIGDRETWRRRILADALREAHRRGVDEGAATALRRADEAEAIANLAMAEGLRAVEGYRMLLEASYDKGLDLTCNEIRAQRRADEAEQKTAKLRALLDEAAKLYPSLGEMFAKELAEIGGKDG